MTRTTLVTRYVAFAILATLLNLAVQRMVLSVDGGAVGFAAAVGLGTLAGLALKYALDKRWIFGDLSRGVAAHGRKFSMYTAMGVITTAIFWGTETAFWVVWKTDGMRELGAVLGLAAGYVIKYRLDRRFVFPRPGIGRLA
ncbi:GtrA family protein [Marivita sp. GX14005]|uniref:GtrA family protein n=1 Tax=Marivita sp. GX14005 TaxID=2942276 RepID=UPI0020195721|nr:GtrA family protein [Marivita sp. GX14005]MCL3881726.1 GtrA family protein [Marivita sp. GX14005]